MATNVTEKDKTLNEIIADNYGSDAVYDRLQGQVDAYEGIALKCINLCREATDDAN